MFALKALITGKLSDKKKKILIRALLQKSSLERSANYGCTYYGNKRQQWRDVLTTAGVGLDRSRSGSVKNKPFFQLKKKIGIVQMCPAGQFLAFYRKMDAPKFIVRPLQIFTKVMQSPHI